MIPTPHTFYDNFSYKGKWWLPRTRQKVDGELSVKGGEEIRLQLFGGFKKQPPFQLQPVIHGMTDGGVNVTLLHNQWATGYFGSAGHVRSTYQPAQCVFGLWADGRDDVPFNKLRLQLTHLESWLANHPFGWRPTFEGAANKLLTVTYTFDDPIAVHVPDPPMTIIVETSVDQDEQMYRSFSLKHSVVIDITPKSPMSLDQTFALVSTLRQFFSLMMGRQVFVLRMSGEVTVRQRVRGRRGTGKKANVPCDVFFTQTGQEPIGDSDVSLFFTRDRLGERFPQLLRNWFASMPTLRPVYEVFFSMFRSGGMYLQSRFLHLSQAVESFHRRTLGGLYLPDDQYDPIKLAVIAAIPPTVGTGLRARLKSQIQYANEPSLRKRLTAIIAGLSHGERQVICDVPGDFVSAVVDTRNYLTHLDESSGDHILDSQGLLDAGTKLELLMAILLLKHIGLPADEVLERVKQTGRIDLTPFKWRTATSSPNA